MDTFIEICKKVTDIQPLLALFKSGRFIRNTLSIAYQIIAVLLGLALFVFWFRFWGIIGHLKFFGGLGVLIWQLAFPYAAFLAVKTLYLRAKDITSLPDSDYVVVPVIAMLTKTGGEMLFIFLAIMSLPATLLAWLGGSSIAYYVDFIPSGSVFFAGIYAFLLSWIIGFFALVLTQFFAEWTLALFSIANDVNLLRRNAIPQDEPVAPEPTAAPEFVEPAVENEG
jgi:hypothetical protein